MPTDCNLTANYALSKNLQFVSSPDIFNCDNGKDIVAANPPQVLRIAFSYQTPRAEASLPLVGTRWVSYALAASVRVVVLPNRLLYRPPFEQRI